MFATSKDGTRIPFFVVHGKDLTRNGRTPTVLYGYGGFQLSETPYFASSIYPWLENGGIWVGANLRGGAEYGEPWHRHGMRHEKQNVFDDYFAVAEELVKQGFTSPAKLVAHRRVERRVAGGRGGHPAAGPVQGRPLPGAAARHAALPAVRLKARRGSRSTGRPRTPRTSRPSTPTPPITTSPRGRSTHRRCSSAPTATTGSTRCTRASSPPSCSGPRPGGPSSCAWKNTRGTEGPIW